jgi:N-acetylmuramoyl-L-alanine amidase
VRRSRPPDLGDADGAPLARGVLRHIGVVLAAAALFATAFTAWTPASLSTGEFVEQLIQAASARPPKPVAPGPGEPIVPVESGVRIGIVAGHSGPGRDSGYVDPGAVCDDGLTELEVNQNIANLVVRSLQAAGYNADMLQEWDPRLTGYRAVALVSIHADSCLALGSDATGYKVAAAIDTAVPDRAQRLVDCLADRYGQATGLPYQRNSITRDMTEYHTFYEINSDTPAAIIETGFLYLDREFLTREPERAARGITEGILCYINNEPATPPTQGGS